MARTVFRFSAGQGYVVSAFIEKHTHCLSSETYRQFLKANRNLDPGHQNFVLNCARANIGPMKSYRLYKEIVGGYSSVGCTSVDFKNFSHDLKAYVIGVDAQMVLDKLFKKRDICSGFVVEYEVDEEDHLTCLFWADPLMRRNYATFGYVVSFDATYETNRYNMIFAPFTGKDNHGKAITFGAGLLSGEKVGSYVWLFQKFKDYMGHCPSMIITDQDPTIKIAVEHVLIGTRHRLCMWHIMCKISDKVPTNLKKDENFMKKLNKIVWSEMYEPQYFEEKWNEVMTEFGLMDDTWFKSMYEIRQDWLPAYFRDFAMSALFRTTSMSESENSFFGRYLSPRSNLLQFFMQFDSAIDAQRHAQEHADSEDLSCIPDLKTPLLFEKDAANLYTCKIFTEVQSDIVFACFDCRVLRITNEEDRCIYKIQDNTNGIFIVLHDRLGNTTTCSCKKFGRFGLLCCHIFVLFKDLKYDSIPDTYVVTRWKKSASLRPLLQIGEEATQLGADNDERKLIMNQIYSEFYYCVGQVESNAEMMSQLLRGIRDQKSLIMSGEGQYSNVSCKRKLFDNFYGSSVPTEVRVLPPLPVKTKGSGSRLQSRKEKAIEQSKKPLRMCSKCKTKTNHDARNCGKFVGDNV